MQKSILLILSFALVLSLMSCSWAESVMPFIQDSAKTADITFSEIISAIKSADASKIVDMFAISVQKGQDLSESSVNLINFIQGDITSVSSAVDGGVGANRELDYGKRRKEILSAFTVTTTTNTYHFAVLECVLDEFDNNNVGLLSVFVIDANNWQSSSVYRGDGKWSHGIHIVITDEGT